VNGGKFFPVLFLDGVLVPAGFHRLSCRAPVFLTKTVMRAMGMSLAPLGIMAGQLPSRSQGSLSLYLVRVWE